MKSHMLPEPEDQAYEPDARRTLPRAEGAESSLPEENLLNMVSQLWEGDRPAFDMPIRTFLRVILAH